VICETRVTDPDLDRRLDVIERNQIALANSLRTLLARVDRIEEDLANFDIVEVVDGDVV